MAHPVEDYIYPVIMIKNRNLLAFVLLLVITLLLTSCAPSRVSVFNHKGCPGGEEKYALKAAYVLSRDKLDSDVVEGIFPQEYVYSPYVPLFQYMENCIGRQFDSFVRIDSLSEESDASIIFSPNVSTRTRPGIITWPPNSFNITISMGIYNNDRLKKMEISGSGKSNGGWGTEAMQKAVAEIQSQIGKREIESIVATNRTNEKNTEHLFRNLEQKNNATQNSTPEKQLPGPRLKYLASVDVAVADNLPYEFAINYLKTIPFTSYPNTGFTEKGVWAQNAEALPKESILEWPYSSLISYEISTETTGRIRLHFHDKYGNYLICYALVESYSTATKIATALESLGIHQQI